MNGVKKRNLPVVKTIKYNNCLCLEINNLWHALYSTFNLAQDYYVDIEVLDEITDKSPEEWPLFSKEEFMKAVTKCNNLSGAVHTGVEVRRMYSEMSGLVERP